MSWPRQQSGRLPAFWDFRFQNFALACEVYSRLRGALPSLLAWWVRISYSLYLVHVPVLLVLREFLPMGDSAVGWPLRYLVYGSACILSGYLFYQGVERWFLRGRAGRSDRSDRSAVAAPGHP